MMWATCCCSPLLYLGASWVIRRFTGGKAFYPLTHDRWIKSIIAISILSIVLQIIHIIIKLRAKAPLATAIPNTSAYIKLLTRRTFALIFVSELPVFSGFILSLLQGNLAPVFGFGLVSMLLYAQSHPRSANPAFS
jgi:hypothetical protein